MKSTDLPSPNVPLLFTGHDGIQHNGFYNGLLKVFVERVGDETSGEVGVTFTLDNIREWEYQDDQESSDADILEIL
ncbi:hypothetical protein [Dyadobacter sp. LHD-138]|uniref:hypothetical protein n=1 Tax=Dyadobacter sp. LHD-138 TaxID=3071413 RepID=UPI0027DFB455|nr:hypothetical protein [Dyadobacter sp. LHD-138]MDQ6477545.1 hypothetical protein [Dyadobacter sp. LHD-138]